MEPITAILIFSGVLFYWLSNIGLAWKKQKEKFNLGIFLRDNFVTLVGSILVCVLLVVAKQEAETYLGLKIDTKISAVFAGWLSPSVLNKFIKALKK